MYKDRVLCVVMGVCFFVMVIISGCASARPVLIAGVPDDLSLDLAVLPASGVTNVILFGKALPVRQAHYLLYADGSLHARRGSSAYFASFVPLTRRLTTDEMLEVWQYLNRLEFIDARSASGDMTTTVEWPSDGVSYLVWFRARGVEEFGRLNTVGVGSADEEQLRIMSELVALLDRLSWGGFIINNQ